MLNFVKIDVVSSTADVTTVDFENSENQRDDEDLQIGIKARHYLLEIEEECDPAIIKKFYEYVFN